MLPRVHSGGARHFLNYSIFPPGHFARLFLIHRRNIPPLLPSTWSRNLFAKFHRRDSPNNAVRLTSPSNEPVPSIHTSNSETRRVGCGRSQRHQFASNDPSWNKLSPAILPLHRELLSSSFLLQLQWEACSKIKNFARQLCHGNKDSRGEKIKKDSSRFANTLLDAHLVLDLYAREK